MHLHLKWLRLPDTPLRNHVMRDFYCFLPILSFPFGSTASRYHARQHQILGFHWDPGFLPDVADRGFRLLSVANIPWCKFMRYLKVQTLRFRISRIWEQSRILYTDLVDSSAFKIQNLVQHRWYFETKFKRNQRYLHFLIANKYIKLLKNEDILAIKSSKISSE